MKTDKQQQALESFIFYVQKNIKLCDAIKDKLDNHQGIDPDNVNFGNVGDVQHIHEILREVAIKLQIDIND